MGEAPQLMRLIKRAVSKRQNRVFSKLTLAACLTCLLVLLLHRQEKSIPRHDTATFEKPMDSEFQQSRVAPLLFRHFNGITSETERISQGCSEFLILSVGLLHSHSERHHFSCVTAPYSEKNCAVYILVMYGGFDHHFARSIDVSLHV